MAFTKAAMQDELMQFMQGFTASVERMYGGRASEILADEEQIKKSPLWLTVSEMYDYGVSGVQIAGLGKDCTVDGSHADVELFLSCLDSLEMYLEEDDVCLPRLSMRAVRTAIARHVLDGGERYTDFGAAECGLGNGDWEYLTLGEVALLADMDERSVRNAANPKLPDPLETENVGKRSLVTVEEARRWLAGRKGFILTMPGSSGERSRTVGVTLQAETVERLRIRAQQAGLSVADFIDQHLV